VFSPAASYLVGVPLDRKWLHAQVNLAIRVVVHVVRRLWPWSPRYGLARFQHNYVVEHLPPATAEHRALAETPGRCTGCGACDDVCPILGGTAGIDADAFGGPHAFVVAGARASTNLDDIAGALDTLTGPTCAACGACDRTCPEEIPIRALAASLHAQRLVVDDARRGRLPIAAGDVAARASAARGPRTVPVDPAAAPPRSLPEAR
jgi:ferredoxin